MHTDYYARMKPSAADFPERRSQAGSPVQDGGLVCFPLAPTINTSIVVGVRPPFGST